MSRTSVVELLNSICRFADAVGFPRGGGLASLPPELKLSELSRLVRELNDVITYEMDSNAADGVVVLINSPQASVALIQLHAAALRLATDPWDKQLLDATAAPASLGATAFQQTQQQQQQGKEARHVRRARTRVERRASVAERPSRKTS